MNEKGYIVERGQRMNAAYRTYHGNVVPPSNVIAPDFGPNGCKFALKMPPHEIRWEWLCEGTGANISTAKDMRYFWLTPIAIRAV